MNRIHATKWWMPAVRGGSALAMGAAALLAPGMPLGFLDLLFAVFASATGLAYVAGGRQCRREGAAPGGYLLAGMVSLCAGVLALLRPAPTALVLLLLMATHALATGLLDAAGAYRLRRLRRQLPGMRLLGLAALVAGGFSVAVFAAPAAAALAPGMSVGLYGMVNGTMWLGLALAWRRAAGAIAGPRACALRRGCGDESASGLRRRSI